MPKTAKGFLMAAVTTLAILYIAVRVAPVRNFVGLPPPSGS